MNQYPTKDNTMATPQKVWSRFTKIIHGKEIKFKIHEVTKDKFEKVFVSACNYFIPEEPIHRASKLPEKIEVLEEYRQGWTMLAIDKDYQIDVCSIDDDSEEWQIVSASIMKLEKKDEGKFDPNAMKSTGKAQEIETFIELLNAINEMYDVREKYKLDTYYDDQALFVHPDYRGLGIAGEMFKARVVICKERGVPMTGAWMTTIGSQIAAARLGWETICEVNYKEFGQKYGVSFDGMEDLPDSFKLMVTRV